MRKAAVVSVGRGEVGKNQNRLTLHIYMAARFSLLKTGYYIVIRRHFFSLRLPLLPLSADSSPAKNPKHNPTSFSILQSSSPVLCLFVLFSTQHCLSPPIIHVLYVQRVNFLSSPSSFFRKKKKPLVCLCPNCYLLGKEIFVSYCLLCWLLLTYLLLTFLP